MRRDGEKSEEIYLRTIPASAEKSGTELITALKNRKETSKIPIAIITGKGNVERESEKRADFAIYKDIEIESQLVKALSVLAESPKARGQARY